MIVVQKYKNKRKQVNLPQISQIGTKKAEVEILGFSFIKLDCVIAK